DVVGKLEAPLEAAPGNAAVQELPLLAVRLLLAAHRDGLLLHVDVELVLAETGHRHGDPVLVVAQALDVVGRIAHSVAIEARGAVQQIEQAVEANGRAIEGAEIKMSHHESSLRSDCGRCLPSSSTTLPQGPGGDRDTPDKQRASPPEFRCNL